MGVQGHPPGVNTYSAEGRACGTSQIAERALQLLEVTQEQGLPQVRITYSAVIWACGSSQIAERTLQLFEVKPVQESRQLCSPTHLHCRDQCMPNVPLGRADHAALCRDTRAKTPTSFDHLLCSDHCIPFVPDGNEGLATLWVSSGRVSCLMRSPTHQGFVRAGRARRQC